MTKIGKITRPTSAVPSCEKRAHRDLVYLTLNFLSDATDFPHDNTAKRLAALSNLQTPSTEIGAFGTPTNRKTNEKNVGDDKVPVGERHVTGMPFLTSIATEIVHPCRLFATL